ncbi:MAG TPA: PASTA domain-containing protein [Gaiellaceae bacterium]|nr:PASTA domain-containing protein [Gaiellaceae bacterium]
MPEPPHRPPDDDETRILPRDDDAWPEEDAPTTYRPRPAAPPPPRPLPRRREYAYEERREPRRPEPPPPPPQRELWPWLLALLAVVLAGIAALWLLSRDGGEDAERVGVPAVVRLTEEDARDRLQERGFQVEVERAANEAPPGIVFAQTPGAGRTLPDGATVTIHVSEGPDTTAVPSVVGLPEPQALERLEGAELEAEREQVFSEEPQGVVVAQEPAAGEEVERGSSVRIQVSQGSGRVEVPDVVGLLVDEARAALAEQDLEANVVEVPSREPQGTVVAQSPAGGAEATRGDRVRLNVSRGP